MLPRSLLRLVRRWAGVGMALVLAGCAGLSASPRSPFPDSGAVLDGLAKNYSPENVNACIALPLAQQTPCRDVIVQALMAAIDLRYAEFELGQFDTNRYGNFGATVGVLGLTTAGALSGAGTARALAAAAAGLTGTRESFNREVLVEHTIVALQTSMQARRAEVAVRIREGLRRPATSYPLGAALSDLYAYFRGGTLVGALVGVTESASERADEARGRLDATVVSPELQRMPPAVVAVPPLPPPPVPGTGTGTLPRGGAPAAGLLDPAVQGRLRTFAAAIRREDDPGTLARVAAALAIPVAAGATPQALRATIILAVDTRVRRTGSDHRREMDEVSRASSPILGREF